MTLEPMTRDEIIAMAKQGIPPRDIAPKAQRTVDAIYNVISHARRTGHDIPPLPHSGRRPKLTNVAPSLEQKLRAFSEPRGITVKQLVTRLLEIIVADDLVDAILDDGGVDDV